MSKVIVIGGGIIGLSSAWFLCRSGHDVVVIDRPSDITNCSYGNAGYVCPSHFIPLAAPGIVWQGFKWMFRTTSPFYVEPRFSLPLLRWGWHFMRSATAANVEHAAVPLRDIALLSQREYNQWAELPGLNFSYEHKGLLEIFQQEKTREHAKHTVDKALQLGLDTELLDQSQLFAKEPQTKINAIGAIFFKCDAHLYPDKLMQQLLLQLREMGVQFVQDSVSSFETRGGMISNVITPRDAYGAHQVVIAAGSWSREIANMAGIHFPLVAGRGYSVTLENSPYRVHHPAVLMEGRAALTPMDGNKIRFGGTMEITSTSRPPRIKRVEGLLAAVKRFYPEFEVLVPPVEQAWYGYRPCSADGLPYIGRSGKVKNVVIATGHAMLGLSLGAGTGKLVSEIVDGRKTSMDITPFAPGRFS